MNPNVNHVKKGILLTHHCAPVESCPWRAWAVSVARQWQISQQGMQWFQMHWRSNRLLLLLHPFQLTSLYLCEVSSWGSHYGMWTPLQLLPQIPLWIKLHWAVLGGCEATVQVQATTQENGWHGKASSGMPQWHPIVADPKVQILKLYMIKSLTHGFWSIKFANCSVCFMDAYWKGLNGPQAVWAQRQRSLCHAGCSNHFWKR